MKQRRGKMAILGVLLGVGTGGEGLCGTLELISNEANAYMVQGGSITLPTNSYVTWNIYVGSEGGGFGAGNARSEQCDWVIVKNGGTVYETRSTSSRDLRITNGSAGVEKVEWRCRLQRKQDLSVNWPEIKGYLRIQWYQDGSYGIAPETNTYQGRMWLQHGTGAIEESFTHSFFSNYWTSQSVPAQSSGSWKGRIHYPEMITGSNKDIRTLVNSECVSGTCSQILIQATCNGNVCNNIYPSHNGTQVEWGQRIMYGWGDKMEVRLESGETGIYEGQIFVQLDTV